MTPLERAISGFAGKTRARLLLTLRRGDYHAALAPFPRINGPALIVGGAPGSELPAGVDNRWFCLTINMSQNVAEAFGFPVPDLTVFRDGMMHQGPYQSMAWRFLKGRHTKHLAPIWGSWADTGLEQTMAKHEYTAEKITLINRHVRSAVIADVTGKLLVSLGGMLSVSNGLFATVLALKLGASPVVMTGFSFTKGGYRHAAAPPESRGHVPGDTIVARALRARNLPVFAASPEYAKESGLRMWNGG